jgi:uncharacterized protein (UPF0276 family)
MHLAGHQHCGTHIIDTHDRPVVDNVWELFRLAWSLTGGVSTLLEWDGNIPSFDECMVELNKAKHFMHENVAPLVLKNELHTNDEALSTPIDFLVSQVMENTLAG